MMITLVLLAAACGQSAPSPTTPSSSSPAPPFTLSGVGYESTADGRRPLADVEIDVSPEYQVNLPTATTDAEGRYQVSGLSQQNVKVIATKAGYSQPCRAPIALTADGVLDIYLVSDAILSITGAPSSMPVLQPTLSGLVFERTPQGARAIAGTSVVADFSAGNGWAPSARTMTDAAGRYVLCGIDDIGFGLEVIAFKPGYRDAALLVDVRVTRSVDFELVPQGKSQAVTHNIELKRR